jgi:diguanylate cyclase (GGDEF)-like protein/PAS domain S-box-containing protein
LLFVRVGTSGAIAPASIQWEKTLGTLRPFGLLLRKNGLGLVSFVMAGRPANGRGTSKRLEVGMEFNQKVRDFVKQCEAKLPHINSEEGTKVALVLPFLRHLGYNTADPCEVSLEFTADRGIKKGEKVDIVVSVNNQPTFLIEVKPYGSDLSVHDIQLFRYFAATSADFAVLTDGITYKFFSDLESTNKLDKQPFLEVNLLEADDAQLARLQQVFDKKTLDLTELPSVVRDLKEMNKIRHDKHQRLLKVAIVGGGKRGSEILEMAALGELKIEIIGVADIDQNAPGIKSAKEKGIYTTGDYKDLYQLEGLVLIIELTGDHAVHEDINETKPYDVQIVGYKGARLLWDVIADERKTRKEYMRIFETSKDVIYQTTREGKFININQAGVDLFGYNKKELLEIDLAKDLYVDPKDRKRFQEMMEKNGFVKDYEVWFKKKDKTGIYVSITANARKDLKGEILGYEGIIRDVTENKRLFEEVKVWAEKDPLTGLYNYRRIKELLEYEIERAKRGPHIFSIMMLDVDDLKFINDTHGHLVGDMVLKDVAAILTNTSRSVDSIGRYGGDEFLMILPYTDGEKAKTLTQRIIKEVRQEEIKVDEKKNLPIRLSIGVATCPFDSIYLRELIALADRSMYESKRLGRRVVSTSLPEVAEYLTAESPSLDVLEGLVIAVNGKDHYTKAHSDQVSKFSLSLGNEMALSYKKLEALRIASQLHDIGKLGIPERILKKPGPLVKEEFELIKQPPRLGVMMLSGPPACKKYVLNAVMHHHERYDGKGYPGRL